MTELMNQLNIQKAIFLGHDWGGFLAWRMCIHYPDRVRAVMRLNQDISFAIDTTTIID